MVVAYAHYATHKAVAVLVLQGYDGIGVYMAAVQMAIDIEHLLIQVYHALGYILAVCLVGREGEVKRLSGTNAGHVFLKVVEGYAKAADEHKGLVVAGFLYELLLTIGDIIELVGHADILVVFLFHNVYMCNE